MKKHELLVMLALAAALMTVGLTMLIGAYGLIICGAALFGVSFFVNVEG